MSGSEFKTAPLSAALCRTLADVAGLAGAALDLTTGLGRPRWLEWDSQGDRVTCNYAAMRESAFREYYRNERDDVEMTLGGRP